MGRKRKKQKEKEGFKVETAKDPIDVDDPKVVEAVESREKEQADHMETLLDEAPDEDLPDPDRNKEPDEQPEDETPSDETAETEQESQPEARDPEVETEAKAEEQPPTEEVKPDETADVPESTEQPAEQPASPQYVPGEKYGDYEVEITTEDGVKAVPLNNLITTYHKYPETQRKWAALKPVYELAEKAQVEVNQVLPLLELGIQTYAKQMGIMQGTQPPVGDSFTPQPFTPAATPGGYQGPFKDAESDAYYKEADPEMWETQHRNFQLANQATNRITSLEYEMRQMKEAPEPQPQGPTQEQIREAFEGKIKAWAGDHTDYFTAENIGKVRLVNFQNYIQKNHAGSGLKIADLTPEFLQIEFLKFDPKYVNAYMEKKALQKAKDAQNDSGMFAETSGVRSKAVPLDEQQGHMADML